MTSAIAKRAELPRTAEDGLQTNASIITAPGKAEIIELPAPTEGAQLSAIAFACGGQTGELAINRGKYNPVAPLGGNKRSGTRGELGRAGVEEYLQTKSLQLPI